jgi:hypothetical protein
MRRPATTIRSGLAIAGLLALAGCYTSETAILTAEDAQPLPGVAEGIYCHAENRLIPPHVTVAPQVSEALGGNKCRDLVWDAERGRYLDRLSSSMVFRTAPTHLPELALLQVQTGEDAVARYMPVAAVDGMFILYDPAGEWPEGIVAAHGLALTEDGTLAAASAEAVTALLGDVWDRVLEDIRTDVAFVEDEAGPRLEFKRVDTAYRYLVHFRQDWSGNAEKMRGAMLGLADALGLGKYDATWTDHAE